MAYSYSTFTGNGSTTQYAVTFPYIRKEHVFVAVNYVNQPTFTWVNSTTIQLPTAPGNGLLVEVRRATPVNAPLVDFVDGSTLVAADLDTNALQQVYVNQEQDDQFQDAIFINAQGNLDAGGKPLKNLGAPTDAADAATKSYVDTADGLRLKRDGTQAMTGALAMGGYKVTGLATGTASTDATTKGQVDADVAIVTASAAAASAAASAAIQIANAAVVPQSTLQVLEPLGILVNAAFSVGKPGAIPFGVGPVLVPGTAFSGISQSDYYPIHHASGSFC